METSRNYMVVNNKIIVYAWLNPARMVLMFVLLKPNFIEYLAIHTNCSLSNCTIWNFKDLNRSSEPLVIN